MLEVSSPGVGRRLSSHEQLRRQVGRLVEVAHPGGSDTGRLVEVRADALVLDVPATKREPARTVTLVLGPELHAVVQVEFRRTGADGATPDVDEAGPHEPATEGDI